MTSPTDVVNGALDLVLPAVGDRRRARRDLIRVLVAANLLLGAVYLSWRWTASINWDFWWVAVPLVLAETYSFADALLFGLTMWRLKERGEPAPAPAEATVDVFITCYNEPIELVRRTVRAALAIRHPHSVYVLDDGDSAAMRAMAEEEGCGYVRRGEEWAERARHAKAGNLNNALAQTSGEFLLILDADQIPRPEILDRTLGYFGDPQVALVQTPQLFYNVPAGDPFGTQAPLFYGPIQQGKDGWNAAFFCGSNAVLRREALIQLGIRGYVTAVTRNLDDVLRTAARITGAAARGARRRLLPAVAEALDSVRLAALEARRDHRSGTPSQEVTARFQASVDAASRRLVEHDVAAMREDLAALGMIAEDAEVENAISVLSRRDWSPLGAIETVRHLVRAIDVTRDDEAVPVMPMVTISVTEDMATAMRLHALGWRSVYHQEVLAEGLAPDDLRSALGQRLRWAQGTIQILLKENPMRVRGLSIGQRLMYLATMWSYLSGFAAVVFIAGPVLYLCFSISPVRAWSGDFFWHLLPYLAVNQVLFIVVGWGRSTWRGQQYSLALFPLWLQACTSAAANVFFGVKLNFLVTPKERTGPVERDWRLIRWQLVAMAALAASCVVGLLKVSLGAAVDSTAILANVAWAAYDLLVLSVILDAYFYDPERSGGALETMRT